MTNNLTKKYISLFIGSVYILSYFFQSFGFVDFNKVYADEEQLEHTNLVAVLVDNQIYDEIEDEIKRYTQEYIQGGESDTRYNSVSNSKAIVLPMDINAMEATDITKILENMYFDGISGEPSKLVGTVLIGDIPLPVVNQDGFIYPTIYPYVDFEEQKFIWDDLTNYFVFNDNPYGQAEIWHGLINFDEIGEYKQYFDKLQNYTNEPSEFIGKNIWYDDLIADKQYFYKEALNSYMNNFIFAEDIGYRRYTDLMVKLMQETHNDMIADLLSGFDGMEELQSATDEMNTPTMSLETMIKEGYIKSYSNLIAGKQLDNIVKNVETANRWIESYSGSDGSTKTRTALDTHYLKMEQKDETLLRMEGGLDPLIISFNEVLEDLVNEKIEEEKYWMNEVIPLTYLEYDGGKKINALKPWKYKWVREKYEAFDNYFFGINAKNIGSMEQTSAYRGTFRNYENIDGLTIEDIQESEQPSSDIDDVIDINNKSIGGSYDIFSTQIEANRGYNIKNSKEEYNIYEENKIADRQYRSTTCQKKFLGICWKKRKREASIQEGEECDINDEEKQGGCESPMEFAIRNRGGASPLNLSGMNDWTNGYNFQDAVFPIFDIAGSKALTGIETTANSFEGMSEYSRLIQKLFVPNQSKFYTKNADREKPDLYGKGYNSSMGEDMKFTNWMPGGDLDPPTWTYTNPMLESNVNYFDKYNDTETSWEGDIIKIKKEYDHDYGGRGEIFTYKTLDSRVENNLSTKLEISGGTFKAFKDDGSPVKDFYEGMLDKIGRIDDTVVAQIDSLQASTQSGIVNNLNNLSTYVQGIEGDIEGIINYSISSLSSLSSTQIQTLADQRKESLTQQDYANITGQTETIKDQMINLDSFAENFSFDYFDEYIEQQIYNFQINKRDLILLEDWTTNILTGLMATKNKFSSIGPYIDNAENAYNTIPNLASTWNTQLLAKKGLINAAITNSSGVSLGCNSTYAELCDAIDIVRDNLTDYRSEINDTVDEIADFEFENFNLNGISIGLFPVQPFTAIQNKINSSNIGSEYFAIATKLDMIPSSSNEDLELSIPGMNEATSDRPIDSPKYITFKGIGGDKVTFIYPNLYKSEVFSGTNILELKSPEEIEIAIKTYLRETVKQYNQYLNQQKSQRTSYYNANSSAFDKLKVGDSLASPEDVNNSIRPYNLIPIDYLIDELEAKMNDNTFFVDQMGGYEPIEFIAHMIYYQNIGWEQREAGDTIKEDIYNTRTAFDVNDRIRHIVDNYLITGNNKGNFITPGYRDDGYEVAFINSDGADYITYKDEPSFVQRVRSAASNYSTQTPPQIEQTQLEEELQNECNIPEDGGVMLFDLENMDSPWLKALRCWREKISDKPFEFRFDRSSFQGPVFNLGNSGDSVGEIIADNLGVDEVQSQYMNQLGLLDTDDENQEVLDNSNPGDYQRLEQIISYTVLEIEDQNINADEAAGEITVSAGIELGDVEFYIQNIGSSIFNLDGISANITQGTTGYQTGNITFDPFEKENIKFEITEPVAGTNVLVFHMCLPGTQDINNCVKKTIRINVIPGALTNIKVETPGNKILEGSRLPVLVKGEDRFGNNVGNLLTERFNISVSSGSLSYQANKSNKITFSDFSKSEFILNADEGTKDGDQIRIDVSDKDGSRAFSGNSIIQVVKGYMDIKQGGVSIGDLSVDLPNSNEYSYKDSFDITQSNLTTIPKIILELKDNLGSGINIESIVNVKTQNGLLKPGNIESRSITKSLEDMTLEVTQNRFKQENNHIISDGQVTIYLMPTFKAGEDTIYISMPGIDEIQIPVVVNPADASVIEMTSKKDSIATNSNTKASLKVTDIWGNIITDNTMIKLGAIGPIAISGFNSSSQIITVEGGEKEFDVNSMDQGGAGFVYAMIDGLSLDEQKPGNADITVQERILPEEDLNIMYLNLFGSDWGNQWGYMSENDKYVEKLISNSDKLLTTTTQLVSPKNIKKVATIIDPKLQISNIDELDIDLELDGSILINVGEIGSINIDINELETQEVDVSEDNQDLVIQDLVEDKYEDENVLIYLPENTDSIVTSNEINDDAIFINGENLFDLNTMESDGKLKITLSNDDILGYQIWDLSFNDKLIGKIIIVINNENTVSLELSTNDPKYDFDEVWLDGSTNKNGIGFYEIDSSLPDDAMGYESIQDSIDPELSIGFRHDFKNVTNFGAGESVGQATLPFSSEFLINIGDPLLKRVNENENAVTYDEDDEEIDTGFDKGLGEVIYSEPGKTIFKVKNIDFNNDDLEDIIVSFTDGTIKILKNYGGNTPFEKLGDLMTLADGIKDIIIGDVDGNGYEDIIIWSKSDTLRVYKNEEGVFDVDGYPICLNTNVKDGIISEDPQNIGGVFQIFFEDMDQDGSLDIVTNDKFGYIKIFYGGEDNPRNEDNYVSSNKYNCDENWYGKQSYEDNTNMVYRFGIRVNENVKVLDQSLVHWLGINPDEDINIDPQDLGIDTDVFDEDNFDEDNLEEIMENAMGFDINAGIQQYKSIERYKESNFKVIPLYEDFENQSEVEYVEIGCLTGEDPIKIYKQYEDLNGDVLENGDTVQISVILEADQDFVGTFIDRITGPWKISLLENDMMEYFWFDTGTISEYEIENELEFHRDMVNSRYMMDNIRLSAGEELKFNYRVTYDGDVQTSKIEIKDIEGDNYHGFGTDDGETLDEYPEDEYPDIKVKPDGGCNKSMFILFNEDQEKDYSPEYVDLTELMMDYSNSAQENLDNAMSDITNTLLEGANSEDGGGDFSSIPGMDSVTESWDVGDMFSDAFSMDSLISNGGVDLSEIANAPMELIDGLMGDVMDKVDELMGDMCAGFDLSDYGLGDSGNCGLPVPFNQAFLGPGDYHLFGCLKTPLEAVSQTLGKGIPVLNIPGNRGPTVAGYLPIPGFFGLPYIGPTDNFLGGPQVGTYPSQFRLYVVPTLTAEIGIAMCFGPYTVGSAIPQPASSIGGNCIVTSIPLPCKDAGSLGPNASNEIPEAYLDLEACSTQNVPCYVQDGESTSSLEIVSSSSDSSNMTSAIPDGSFAGGFINIEKEPVTSYGYNTPESGIEIDGVKLFGGADAKNKILGGKAQGLIKTLSKNWMDKQINYIFSNLTNFKVDVYWPDFSEIFGGMGELGTVLKEEKIKDCVSQGGEWDKDNNECNIGEAQKCKNRGKDYIDGECVKKTSKTQNDDALSKLDAWGQNNLMSRGQVSNGSDSAFANPFDKMEAMFEEVPLINLRTENIDVKVPMISSEDITAYTSMSQNWIKTQQDILQEWMDFFAAMIGRCGGDKDIKNFSDLKEAFLSLKEQLKAELQNEIKGLKNSIDDMKQQLQNITDPLKKKEMEDEIASAEEKKVELENKVDSIQKKINAINKLNDKYNLKNLGIYEIFEACEGSKFFIRVDPYGNTEGILPYDIYLLYDTSAEDELIMFTKGFDLIKEKSGRKIKISYERNGQAISNGDVCLKSIVTSENNQCIDLFLGGKLQVLLNNFLDIQTNADQLIGSVKQNIETLELYKKFPLDLYERIHVGDRYLSEISSVINNFLGTLSLWMKTNATRYSQYVDSLILIMTTIQTYQAIIDLSVDWSQKCSSCTNDNYDQFSCMLSLLCPDNLPILEIPPMKIPSVYIDLSHINMATDVKLPKFNFVPTSVPLPSLPNIPSPPQIDVGLDVDQALGMGLDLIGQLMIQLEKFDLSLTLPAIPVIPSPPDLPEIPSFIPSVEMELPLLPPAPKIPELPNEISVAIEAAETIGQILCIVKGNIGLVGEDSIKAKIEQMSQRTYEVPYWDNLDQTLSERNDQGSSKIPDWMKDTFAFLNSEEFEEVELKGFDIGVESYVNLQYNFAGFYDFVDSVVQEINKFSSMPGDLIQEGIDTIDEKSNELEDKMSACVSNPLSTACMGDQYTGDIKEANEWAQEAQNQLSEMENSIENGFEGIKEAMQLIAQKEGEKENLEAKNKTIGENMIKVEDQIDELDADLEITTDENRINRILNDIEDYETTLSGYQKQLDENQILINELQTEIDQLYNQYGETIEAYEEYLESYGELREEYDVMKAKLSERAGAALDAVNEGMSEADGFMDDQMKFEKMEEWNAKMQEKMNIFDKKQEERREQRSNNLDEMYQEISYVDYNEKTYEKSMETLKDSLEEIKSNTENKAFKKKIDEYIKLANINNNMKAADENINTIKGQYKNILASIKNENNNVLVKISNNYNEFLSDVKNNSVSLVANDDIDVSLSTKLFDIDESSLNVIKSQDNIHKTYLDYYSKNIDGYLNAINNHDAEDLNMSQEVYNANKEYLSDLSHKTKIAYNAIEGKTLLAQSSSNSAGSSNGGSFTDISSYIDGKVIKTPEGSIDLANDDYVSDFQGRTLMTDINGDGDNDLILRDDSNVYIKYKNNQNNYDNTEYDDDYYMYEISSYDELLDNSDEGFIEINNIYLKLCDRNWEVKNFEYNGGDFDSVKVIWKNSSALGDEPKGYLIKMIHRVDLFNDKELIISNSNEELFDKKYVLALPKGAPFTGTKISVEEGTYRTEDLLSGLIFDVMYYNENEENINLTIQDIPRNWQYSEIYTLEMYEDTLYYINNSSSNQIVAGPQIIADTKGPEPIITLYRPAIDTVVETGEQFDAYVSTNYILQSHWEDNVSIDRMWIADFDGNNIVTIEDVNEKTGYIELSGLFFTGASSMNYYFGATDINDNSNVTQVNMNIQTPNIEIIDIQKYGDEIEEISSPATVTAEIDHDLDEGYVQFHRYRNDLWQIMTGTIEGVEIDKYDLEPYQTIITGGFYDFGDDIGLYLPNGELAVKINPKNGKIEILDGYQDQVEIMLDYSMKRPMIKVMETDGNLLFMIVLPTKEVIDISADNLETQDLNQEIFGDFQGGKAIIDGDQVLIYVGPNGEIYTEVELYGEYSFDEQSESVIYSFRKTIGGSNMGTIKVKIKNMLDF